MGTCAPRNEVAALYPTHFSNANGGYAAMSEGVSTRVPRVRTR